MIHAEKHEREAVRASMEFPEIPFGFDKNGSSSIFNDGYEKSTGSV